MVLGAVFLISSKVMVGFFKNLQKYVGFDQNLSEHPSKFMESCLENYYHPGSLWYICHLSSHTKWPILLQVLLNNIKIYHLVSDNHHNQAIISGGIGVTLCKFYCSGNGRADGQRKVSPCLPSFPSSSVGPQWSDEPTTILRGREDESEPLSLIGIEPKVVNHLWGLPYMMYRDRLKSFSLVAWLASCPQRRVTQPRKKIFADLCT